MVLGAWHVARIQKKGGKEGIERGGKGKGKGREKREEVRGWERREEEGPPNINILA